MNRATIKMLELHGKIFAKRLGINEQIKAVPNSVNNGWTLYYTKDGTDISLNLNLRGTITECYNQLIFASTVLDVAQEYGCLTERSLD